MTTKTFIKNLLFIGLFFLVVFILVLLWLRVYTNHGQKLVLPDFVNMQVDEAATLAEKESFEIIVNDSVHIIGQPGGIIIDQNPKVNSKVKENRKIYVTTTKYLADKIKVSTLPSLYGRDYERKKRELSFMDISCKIKDYSYDPGEPNHILSVYYNGREIISSDTREEDVELEKGGTLEFILSKGYGGDTSIPDVVCMDYETASFLIETLKLKIGNIQAEGTVTDQSSAFVIAQIPAYDSEGLMQIGDEIELTISQNQPTNCK